MNGDTTELGIGGRCLEARDRTSLGLAAAGGSGQMAGMAFRRRKVVRCAGADSRTGDKILHGASSHVAVAPTATALGYRGTGSSRRPLYPLVDFNGMARQRPAAHS